MSEVSILKGTKRMTHGMEEAHAEEQRLNRVLNMSILMFMTECAPWALPDKIRCEDMNSRVTQFFIDNVEIPVMPAVTGVVFGDSTFTIPYDIAVDPSVCAMKMAELYKFYSPTEIKDDEKPKNSSGVTWVKATFAGANGSLGYETGKEYTLRVKQAKFSHRISIECVTVAKHGHCVYDTIGAFLGNWNNVNWI